MNKIPTLEQLGYDQIIDDNRRINGADIEHVARVSAEHRGAYEIISTTGEYRATVTGRRMQIADGRDDYPAVGDWVVIKDDATDSKVILDILPRKTTIRKKYGGKDSSQLIAANVDTVFIVESINRDYSLNRFERYLVLAKEGGVNPVVVLNKTDLTLVSDLKKTIQEIRERFGEIDVLATNTVSDSGIDELVDYIKSGKTYCFLGSSGVGKSSLINRLLRQEQIATREISEKTGRGMHTTTAREMYITSNGGIIIDNPGSREVGVVDSNTGVVEVFRDIEIIANSCKFSNCKHINEPDCAVRGAISSGKIDKSRYNNYQKLQKETEHYELSIFEKRQKDKKFGKFVKNAKKDLQLFE